ncbi:tyrosine-type recombinase/integrase [Telluribacter sp.]|jgi:site-specific recombinase XerD|uniref:tyrosine-type recombinase/integrase n=1 Tax=Telluribacter sp. TaxID=1978767 RepID=UPI002E11825B|nr:tyrosine-type recombinase/integrase [Telluribacter sp.]
MQEDFQEDKARALVRYSDKVAHYAQAGLEGARNTQRAYQADIRHYYEWCQLQGLTAFPVDAEVLAVYVTHLADECKWATIQRRMAALRKWHELKNEEFPARSRQVQAVLEGIRRVKGIRQKQAPAFSLDEFRPLIQSFDPENVIELRDKVVLLLGFTGAFRRSELVALNIEDLSFSRQGLIITLTQSKTNQYGEIEQKAFFYHPDPLLCPIRTLEEWLALRPAQGPLLVRFRKGKTHGEVRLTEERLSDKSVDNLVKHYLGTEYSAHSLRASFVTAAKLNGADDMEVMQQTKHRTSAMIQRYTRTDDIRKFNAGKKLGL